MDSRPVVTERTGKEWKRLLAIGVGGSVFGLVVAISGWPLVGALVAFAGLATIAVAKLGAWWHHG